MKSKIIVLVLILGLVLSACSPTLSGEVQEITADIEKSDISPLELSEISATEKDKKKEIVDFSLNVYRENYEGDNILISPISIVSGLGMAANGAETGTLEEIETVLGTDRQSLNEYLYSYLESISKEEAYRLDIANSIWFKDSEGLEIKKDFLQTNKDYYDAGIFKAAFDEETKTAINKWTSDKTEGMIDPLLEGEISNDTIMYLINALYFEGEWEEAYMEYEVNPGEFTGEDGEIYSVDFMHSTENIYLEGENSRGIIKPYKGDKYAFLALLPNDGVSMEDFLRDLDSENLEEITKNQSQEKVICNLPKFTMEYGQDLNDSLKNLGMNQAFDGGLADFSSLGTSDEGNISISKVIHKTKIEVDELGSKAGAATAVGIEATSMAPEEVKEINFNRPFFYMIIDTEENLPIFMGSLMSVD